MHLKKLTLNLTINFQKHELPATCDVLQTAWQACRQKMRTKQPIRKKPVSTKISTGWNSI